MVDADEVVERDVEPDELTEEEEEDLNSAEPDSQPVVYSGQDFDINGLIRRVRQGDILVPHFGHEDERIVSAGFQRSFVWSRPQMDRFIESILLGYPIPGIFLIKQTDKRYLVLDGQQRLTTLQSFEDGIHDGKEFSLRNAADRFKGLTYKTLPEELRRVFDDTFIQATIVSTDGSTDSLESIYQIFERLNSGGTQLTPHEIRVALFAGPLIDFIERLNRSDGWRSLYGNRSKRLRDQELVLRILGLYVSSATYRRPLKAFLNAFVAEHRDLARLRSGDLEESFNRAADLILEGPGSDALRLPGGRQVNAALTEAVFVGLMRRLDHGDVPSATDVAEGARRIQGNDDLLAAVGRATADEEQVRTRLEVATRTFAEV
jgi:hypothetical protein